jgi:DNA-directed RNA polymerase subunit RPC12/RpoP
MIGVMIVSIQCPQCGHEFDAEAEERSAVCPACARAVILKTPKVILPKQNAAPITRMTTCADCGSAMSRRALWCQQCGSLQRSLFWLVWNITCEFWVVAAILGIIGWTILQIIHAATS